MATKTPTPSKSTKKTVTTTTYTTRTLGGEETPSTSASPGRRARSPSPARITRQQEKEQLQNLNDRLAAYIDKVRFLETENSRLSVQVRSSEETISREVTNVKTLYESELADARKLLDDLGKEKAALQIELSKYKEDAEEWKLKYHKRDREAKNLENQIQALEKQNADLENKATNAENQRKHLEKENNRLRADLSALERQLANARKELEKETLQRVDLENRVQSLKEDLAFKTQVHQQELSETKRKTVIERDEIDAGVREEYEARLQEQLQELREIQEEQLREVKLEYESMYERRFGDMQSALDRSMTSSDSSREDLRVTKKKISELASEVDKLRSQVSAYESRIRDLEDQLAREQDENSERLTAKDLELGELRQLLNDQMQEYSDLLDVKIKLDNEIMAYRKLLEVEEERLNLSQTSMSSSSPGSTPLGRSKKRKRVALSEEVEEYSSESARSGFAASSSASGDVQISETDAEGKFVKIENKSGGDIAVGGWQLKHTAGDQETTYKFHRNLLLRAGETCTVWSSGVGQTHDPPNDLVMKGSRWFTNDEMKTVLINSDGTEVASRDMKKTIQRTSSSFRSSGYDDVDSRRRSQEERCSIM